MRGGAANKPAREATLSLETYLSICKGALRYSAKGREGGKVIAGDADGNGNAGQSKGLGEYVAHARAPHGW